LKKLFLLLTAFALVVGLSACGGGNDDPKTCEDGFVLVDDECVAETDEAPTITGATDVELFIGNTFDKTANVVATDDKDGDISSDIVITGNVDLTQTGTYTLTYTVTDSNGGVATVTRTVTVSEADLVYPSGFYNYKFATTELRHTFMAAAEKYLMNNMYAGVPLFSNGSFALYSQRLQLPVTQYDSVLGFGNRFATMSHDDSTVVMELGGSNMGNADEFTYRTYNSTNPVTFNQWIYDTSTDSDYMSEYFGSLYDYIFNADKTGYEVTPVMAAELPVPVDSHLTETGKEVSTVWEIEIRDGLEWSYFNNGAAPDYVTDNEITADDFVDTYKIALTEQWFRAISGGGDFLNDNNKIVNAEEYVAGNADWEDVGIKVIAGNKIQFTFVNDQSEWNVKYWLGSFVMAPIHTEMYAELGEDYGTSPSTIAYHGAYTITNYEQDKILKLAKNPNYARPELDWYTHKYFMIIEDSEVAFQTFENGQLEAIGLPSNKYDEYKDHPGLRRIPGATTYRIMINGLGTQTAQNEMFPDSTWTPEPILANNDFKMAMFHALDRQYLAEQVYKTRTTNMYLFSEAYLVDAEMGIPYRLTEQGETVSENLSPSTHGFNADAAVALFKKATAALIADGDLTAGTTTVPTVIELEFNYFTGSDAQVTMFEYIEKSYEEILVDDVNHIELDLVGKAKDFPDIYYDYMMVGNFDLSIGGISGSTLDAASFLDTYSDDNRSGFTLNWGIDTSTANIPVIYNDFQGNRHNEVWSFNAISSVLVGEVYVLNGAEAVVPVAVLEAVTPEGVTFTIDQFANDDYENIKYTIQNYVDGEYVDVAGMVAVVPGADADATKDGHQVVVTGLKDMYSGYISDGSAVEWGDYQIVVTFDYADDETKSDMTISDWFYTGDLGSIKVEINEGTVTTGDDKADDDYPELYSESVNVVVTLDENYTLDAFEVYGQKLNATTKELEWVKLVADTDYTVTSAAGIYDVAGLAPDTMYIFAVTTDEGPTLYGSVTTEPSVVLSAPAADLNSESFDLKVTEDQDFAPLTVDSVVIWEEVLYTFTLDDTKDTIWVPMSGNMTDNMDGTWTFDSLDPETMYQVQVELSDGQMFILDVTTAATAELALVINDNGTTTGDDAKDDDYEEINPDSFIFEVIFDTDATATVATREIFKADSDDSDDVALTTATFTDNLDGSVTVTGLEEDTAYYVIVTLSDDQEYRLDVTTDVWGEIAVWLNPGLDADRISDDYYTNHNSFDVVVVLNGSAIDTVEVYKVVGETETLVTVTKTDVVNAAVTAQYNFTGLDAETEYKVVITLDNDEELVVSATTTAVPAS